MPHDEPARDTFPASAHWVEMANCWLDFWMAGTSNMHKFWQEMLLLPHTHTHDERYHLTIPEPIAHAPGQDLFA